VVEPHTTLLRSRAARARSFCKLTLRTGDPMIRRFLTAVALAVLAGCSGNSPTSPSGGGSGGGAYGGGGGGGGTGGTGGGTTGGGTGGGAAPTTAAITVGNDFFKSGHNGAGNSPVDTVAVGGTVTWTWAGTGSTPHSVQSLGSPSFASSSVQTGDGSMHQVVFATAGTYRYDCAVHGTIMSGTIVVR